jgi:bacterioferritin-associated ferredoxin
MIIILIPVPAIYSIMIVCVCKAVSDRVIRASIEAGNASFEELQFELGVALCCGKCEGAVHEVLEQCATVTEQRVPCLSMVGEQQMESAPVERVAPLRFYERKAA